MSTKVTSENVTIPLTSDGKCVFNASITSIDGGFPNISMQCSCGHGVFAINTDDRSEFSHDIIWAYADRHLDAVIKARKVAV